VAGKAWRRVRPFLVEEKSPAAGDGAIIAWSARDAGDGDGVEPGEMRRKAAEDDEVPPGWVDDELWDAVPPIEFDDSVGDRVPRLLRRGLRRPSTPE
jgi:hypothetical protein